jgi:HSP20 family protein
MATTTLARVAERMPTVFDEFFRPWTDWYDTTNLMGRVLNVPAVNISELKDEYQVSVAVPGMKKDDFTIDVEGNVLTISSEKEESTEDKDGQYTRREYNYSSFTRSFTLPDEVNKEKIEAKYEDGVLKINMPRKEEAKKLLAKQVPIK